MFYFKVAVSVTLGSEFIVYYLRHRRELESRKLAGLVVLSNIISFIIGLLISSRLPSGLVTEKSITNHSHLHMGPNFGILMLVAFPVAFFLSWLIEYLCIRPNVDQKSRRKIFLSCFYANLTSYALLFFLAYYVWWQG